MKTDFENNRHYVECACEAMDHLLVFEFDPPNNPDIRPYQYREMSVQFTSPHYESFWSRVKYAIKFIFKKERYLNTSDCILLDKKNIAAFKRVVQTMELCAKEQEELEHKWVNKVLDKNQIAWHQAQIGTLEELLKQSVAYNDRVGMIQYPELIKEHENKIRDLKSIKP